eukprot:CAMPEP_0119356708 /NCGR_PEP_ID=MMETSP1334-20130426/5242_1 /TAXON_ID=127549 /ORGANISM="Calcidiscus leptoporus, Strain RCC1130" /LENGTH=283 /DNA_ID=CAMNT_0007370795 /DNA_START=425 /DNA_END=1277 /DNA_ORIENTATION=-
MYHKYRTACGAAGSTASWEAVAEHLEATGADVRDDAAASQPANGDDHLARTQRDARDDGVDGVQLVEAVGDCEGAARKASANRLLERRVDRARRHGRVDDHRLERLRQRERVGLRVPDAREAVLVVAPLVELAEAGGAAARRAAMPAVARWAARVEGAVRVVGRARAEELSCAQPKGKAADVAPSVLACHLARQSAIIARKEQLYRRGYAALFSPWYQTTPLMLVRSSPTTIAFHSTESTVPSGMSCADSAQRRSSFRGLAQLAGLFGGSGRQTGQKRARPRS